MTHSNVCLFLVTTSVKSSVQTAKNRSQAKKVEQSLNYEADILPKTNHNADINLEMIPESVQAVQKISSLLATDLKKEQSETEKYERFLENALIGGEVNDTEFQIYHVYLHGVCLILLIKVYLVIMSLWKVSVNH